MEYAGIASGPVGAALEVRVGAADDRYRAVYAALSRVIIVADLVGAIGTNDVKFYS